jgi:hypothetical protein
MPLSCQLYVLTVWLEWHSGLILRSNRERSLSTMQHISDSNSKRGRETRFVKDKVPIPSPRSNEMRQATALRPPAMKNACEGKFLIDRSSGFDISLFGLHNLSLSAH